MRHDTASMLALAFALMATPPALAQGDSSSVQGSITVQGRPLERGRILFHVDDEQFVGGKVKGGHFQLTLVPVGMWRLTIEGPDVPARFADEETSKLTMRVSRGTNSINIDLSK